MLQKNLKSQENVSGFFYSSPIGPLSIILTNDVLSHIFFIKQLKQNETLSTNAKAIQKQLDHYFSGKNFIFDIPFNAAGTELQQKVWQELLCIPIGKTISYGDLATKIGTHPRVVAQACRRNPIPLIIPCHRVIAKNGLGGYSGRLSGKMLEIKQWLLDHEKNCTARNRR